MGNNYFIFITSSRLTERDYYRFGLDFFDKNSYKVKVLVITKFTNPEIKNDINNYYPKNIILNSFDNLLSIKKDLDRYKQGDICLLNFSVDSVKGNHILNYLTNRHIYTIRIYAGLIPKWKSDFEFETTNRCIIFFHKIFHKITTNTFYTILKKSINKIYFRLLTKESIDMVITSNYQTLLENFSKPKAKAILEIHNLDYDNYLEYKKNEIKSDSSYAIFIDQNLMFHEDFLRLQVKTNFNESFYFKELDRIFTLIELKYNIIIKIAGHPSIEKKDYAKFYFGREVIFNKTVELIGQSSFVLMHYSTSINYAVLAKKQIYFLTNNMLKNNYSIGNRIEQYSKLVNQRIIYIDAVHNKIPDLMTINNNIYDKYRNKYIKVNGTEEEYFWKVFLNEYSRSNART